MVSMDWPVYFNDQSGFMAIKIGDETPNFVFRHGTSHLAVNISLFNCVRYAVKQIHVSKPNELPDYQRLTIMNIYRLT